MPAAFSPSLRSGERPSGAELVPIDLLPIVIGLLVTLRFRSRTALCLCGKVLSALRLTASALHRTREPLSWLGPAVR
jgi:hypothetical protein